MSPPTSRRGFLAALAGLYFLPQAQARDVRGVSLPEEIVVAGDESLLRLTGAGVFRFLLIPVYVCGLYLPPRGALGDEPLRVDHARRVSLNMLHDVSARLFIWGLDKGLADNTPGPELEALAPSTERLRALIREIGTLESGSSVAVDYAPRTGTTIRVGDRMIGEAIRGKQFNDALLRVWIGAKPLDGKLKQALLGR